MTPDQLASIHAACFTHKPWGADYLRDLLDGQSTHLFEEPNAFLIARIIAPEAEILTLAVHPDARRNHAAKRLVTALCAQSDMVFLDVAADNTAAHALYLACGFVETGRRRGYYARADAPSIDAVLMTWSKPPAAVGKSPRIG